MTDLIKGIDISTIQGNVDFNAVAATGVKFVICRCGVGNNGVDNLYKQNIANAKVAGLKVMAYHFVFPLPPSPSQPLRDPKAQAKMHADAAAGELAACDLEWPEQPDWAKWGCSAQQITQWVADYLEAYEELTGIRPLIYTYPNFAKSLNLPAWFAQKYKLWIASYQSGAPFIPQPWTDWVLWQDSGGTQHLPDGKPVDTDKARDLSLWDNKTETFPPQPDPVADTVASAIPDAAPAPVAPAPVTPTVTPAPAPAPAQPGFFALIVQLFQGLYNKFVKKQ